jgi:hypothetical protein
MSEKESNRLIERVDALLRRRQEEVREEVPVLTEVVEPDASKVVTPGDPLGDALAADIERALIARLAPELDRRLGVLRAELEREMRRAVREAVAHALSAHGKAPRKG